MKTDRLRRGNKIVWAGNVYVFTYCVRNGEYWEVHLGDKIVTCTSLWEWMIETSFKPKRRKRKYVKRK